MQGISLFLIGISLFSSYESNTSGSHTEIILRDNPSTETVYEYGDDGRIKEVRHEDGTVEIYEYDKNGNLILVTIQSNSSQTDTTSEDNTTGQDATDENTSEEKNDSNVENIPGENKEQTESTSFGENTDTSDETSFDEKDTTEKKQPQGSMETSANDSSEKNKKKTDAEENDTGDNIHIVICFLTELISIILLVLMWRKGEQGGRTNE